MQIYAWFPQASSELYRYAKELCKELCREVLECHWVSFELCRDGDGNGDGDGDGDEDGDGEGDGDGDVCVVCAWIS